MTRLLLPLLAPAALAVPAAPRLIVHAPPSLERYAARVRSIGPERFTEAMRLVGLADPGRPIEVFLGPEGSDLAAGVPPWVSGYAYGAEGVIVLLPARTPSYPDSSLEELLRHEVAHVLVARAAGGQPLPRWFHEGVATIAGSSWGLDDRSRLTLTMVGGNEVSLAEVERQFSGGRGATFEAYAVAGAFVNDLLGRYGDDSVARILAGVARGLSFEDAFREATGTPLADAERSFWRRQSFWYRWVPILTSSVTLWMLVTLLAIWAMGKRRARDAALRRLWDEEESRRLAEARVPPPPDPDELVN
jgi:peptidase MA superfamily protein